MKWLTTTWEPIPKQNFPIWKIWFTCTAIHISFFFFKHRHFSKHTTSRNSNPELCHQCSAIGASMFFILSLGVCASRHRHRSMSSLHNFYFLLPDFHSLLFSTKIECQSNCEISVTFGCGRNAFLLCPSELLALTLLSVPNYVSTQRSFTCIGSTCSTHSQSSSIRYVHVSSLGYGLGVA